MESVDEKPKPAPIYDSEKKDETASTYDTEVGFIQEYAPAADGVELHPKPTADPLDPLNFSRSQKWTCLAIVMTMYFLFTYITTTTVPSFGLIQEQYSITFAQVNWTVAIPALGLAVGPLIWSSLADIYGRRLVFMIGTVIALVATIGAALAPNYGGYMAARFFQGFGVAPGSTVGMAIVNDLFFEHERGQKLGLWVLAIDMGLLVGPLIGGFITLVNQFWVQWLTAILFGVLLVAEFFFLPETLYPRSKMLSKLPTISATGADVEKTSTFYDDIPRTKSLSLFHITPIPGVVTPKIYDSLVQFIKLWSFPNISLIVFFYCFAWYWWILSVITYLPVAYAQYKPEIQGLLFIGLILGTLVSELFFSGTLSDRIMLRFSRRNNNIRIPEHRLWLFYPAMLLTAVGLILWGISVDRSYHWMIGQIAFFLFGAGIQVGNTVTSAYIVDCYPMHAMSVVTFYAVLLNASAFVNPFFIAPWCDNVGFTWTFSAQGLITVAVLLPVTVLVQKFGGRMRAWKGEPNWVSPEYSS